MPQGTREFQTLLSHPSPPQNVIAEHEIRNISCAAQDPEDLCTFAYITKDLQTSHHYCHVFSTVDVVGGVPPRARPEWACGQMASVQCHPGARVAPSKRLVPNEAPAAIQSSPFHTVRRQADRTGGSSKVLVTGLFPLPLR